jgi:hypothetical protein
MTPSVLSRPSARAARARHSTWIGTVAHTPGGIELKASYNDLMVTISDAVRALDRDLHELFRDRLTSLVAYASAEGPGALAPTLAVVQNLTADDLRACAAHVASWQSAGLATPLLLDEQEFGRSLDAFPFEFGAILAEHAIVSGVSPFVGLRVEPADLRRACEIQARSHLLHLREGYLETRGRSDALADLIARSAAPLAALLTHVARLHDPSASHASAAAAYVEARIGRTDHVLTDVVSLGPDKPLTSERARTLFPPYLDAMAKLADHVDRWSGV